MLKWGENLIVLHSTNFVDVPTSSIHIIPPCTRAPFCARINLSHFGDLGFFAKNMYFVLSIIGAGQKNNLSHGPVAQVRIAPMIMIFDYDF